MDRRCGGSPKLLKYKGNCYSCQRTYEGSYKTCDPCRARRKELYLTRHRAKRIQEHKEAHQRLKIEVFKAYGGPKCSCCGEFRLEFLSIDHVNGGGRQHRQQVYGKKDGGNLYAWIKGNGYPHGFRVLCFNCNCAHGFSGYCPHETEVEP